MAKKKKRKKKIKFFRVFLVLLILLLLISLIFLLGKIKVKGYYISGNTYYKDEEILSMTGLDKYPSYLLTTNYSINSKIKNNDLIKNIKIKKTIYGKFKIIIEENKILFYDNIKKKSITESGKEINYYYKLSPVLVSDIQDKKLYDKLVNKIKKVNDNTYQSISEIKYDPNDIDKERFLLSMNDGNYVYVTMSKFDNINDYLEISKTLGTKNGILYLDYGNYFVPKE